MPTTIERSPAANVAAHATEYPPDPERRKQERDEHSSNESHAQRHATETESPKEEPAVVVDADHLEDHLLDGVAAYRAAAQSVLEPERLKPAKPISYKPPDYRAAETVRHAYEDHGGSEETHRLNVST